MKNYLEGGGIFIEYSYWNSMIRLPKRIAGVNYLSTAYLYANAVDLDDYVLDLDFVRVFCEASAKKSTR